MRDLRSIGPYKSLKNRTFYVWIVICLIFKNSR
nr:MAG TPA: hypothetical protein [Inoviridae sp.]